MPTIVGRFHEFSYGHKVTGHEGKCKRYHGHNAQVAFRVRSPGDVLDTIGRVLDFSVMKSTLCQWLEDNWDHKMLLWDKDPDILNIYATWTQEELDTYIEKRGIVVVPFNPTAENMASYLLRFVGPILLADMALELCHITFYETSKCFVEVSL